MMPSSRLCNACTSALSPPASAAPATDTDALVRCHRCLHACTAGEAAGTAFLLATYHGRGRMLLRRALPMPASLLAVLTALSVAALALALLGGSWPALCCLVVIMALNDVATSMCSECQGSTLPARCAAAWQQ